MFDVKKFTKKKAWAGKERFEVEPGEFFPATVKRIQECLKHPFQPPEELIDEARGELAADNANALLKMARALPADAWDLALQPKEQADPEKWTVRAQALALISSWFKDALAIQLGGPLHLHILKDERFKE